LGFEFLHNFYYKKNKKIAIKKLNNEGEYFPFNPLAGNEFPGPEAPARGAAAGLSLERQGVSDSLPETGRSPVKNAVKKRLCRMKEIFNFRKNEEDSPLQCAYEK
jgi:hypothetical protein